jgi:5-methylcytosine-specific restriction endonuclease McrA
MQYRRNRKSLLEQVVLCDGLQCANFGLVFKSKRDRRLTVNHKVPISKGGEHVAIVNLQLLCKECHREKDQEKPRFRPERWRPCEVILPPLFMGLWKVAL